MPPSSIWTETFRVRAYEIGPDDQARVLTLCDYAQEAAGNHAQALGVESFELGHATGAWVLHRLRMAVDRFPSWLEALTLQTWPSAEDGLRADRDFLFLAPDGQPLARAVSTWFVVDLSRRRPIRLPGSVRSIDLPDVARALPPAEPPAAPARIDSERLFSVRRADLDRNGHANNVRFVEWALEGIPDDTAANHRLAAFDIVFLAEAVAEDTVRVETARQAPDGFAHRLVRLRDDKPLAHLTTHWTPR